MWLGKNVNFVIVDGNLEIILLPQGKKEIDTAEAEGVNTASDDFMQELFEHQTCNGWEWIKPEEIGALTDSPILSNDVQRDDDGKLVKVGREFWFPNYQVESPIQTLYEKGKVVFQGRE